MENSESERDNKRTKKLHCLAYDSLTYRNTTNFVGIANLYERIYWLNAHIIYLVHTQEEKENSELPRGKFKSW